MPVMKKEWAGGTGRLGRELEAASRISEALFEFLHPDDLVERALSIALEVVNAEGGAILLAEPESETLVFRHSVGRKPVRSGTSMPWTKGIAGAVFHSGEAVIIDNAQEDPRHFSGIDDLTKVVTRDLIAVPIKRRQGEAIGVLEVVNKNKGRFDENDRALLVIVSVMVAVSYERAKLFEEAKLAEVAKLLGDISHDIKNLLTPVIYGVDILEDELKKTYTELSTSDKDHLDGSEERCRRILSMLAAISHRVQMRMKEISDCVKGRNSTPQFSPCKVADTVGEVFEALADFAREKRVTLKSEGLDDLPVISADEQRLFNAFYNLVNNAVSAIPETGTVTVSGSEDPETGHLVISVADNGRGMSPEVRENLFTSETVGRKGLGSGLGTKIIKDVVDAHEGSISVESEAGKGTTFHLTLPLRA